ncbi:MAG: hypothetical protein ACJ75H_17115 [Thermoanaerobaculia bacterium]
MLDSPVRPAAAGPRARHALAVLALLTLYTAVLYRRALAVGVLSDGWVLLEIGTLGFRKAPFELLSYHTIPVTNLLMALMWKLFGLHERWYQAANLAGMVLVGWLLYLLGCTLFRQVRVALLASLLFLANSSFFEVPFWPTVGNFQSLAALLYLGGLLALARAFESARRWPWIVLFWLCGLAAFFTYEPAVSVLGVGLLYAALVPGGEGESLKPRARRTLATLAATLPAIAVVLGSKVYTSLQGYQAMFLPHDVAAIKERLYLLLRGCVAIFTLRGADPRIHKVLSLGLPLSGGTAGLRALLAVWLVGLVLAGAFVAWRTRTPAVRFAVLWFAAHMVTVSAATGIVSRHFYLGALPASLLLSWGIWSAADFLAPRLAPGSPVARARAGALVAGLALTLLVANSVSDLDVAAAVHREATAATRRVVDIVQQRLAQTPDATPKVALVNMPAVLGREGMGAFTFVNGLHQILRLSTGWRIKDLELYYTYAAFADGKFANASRPISLAELQRRARDPESLVLRFDGATRTVVALDRASWRPPDRYDAEATPYLEWQAGSWPWFRVFAGEPLELPLAVSRERSWVAVRYLRQPGAAFAVTDGAGPGLDIRVPAGTNPSWPVATLPVDGATGEATVTVRPESEVWLAFVRSFSPPADYTPESAPFLSWIIQPFPQFPLDGPIRLPLAADGCAVAPCAVGIEFLAEKGRDFALRVGDGAVRNVSFQDTATPEWRSIQIQVPAGVPLAVAVEPRGPSPVMVRRLGWAPALDYEAK